MLPKVRYKALRARLNEIAAERAEHQAAIAELDKEDFEIRDKMWDLENFDLTEAELADINREEE